MLQSESNAPVDHPVSPLTRLRLTTTLFLAHGLLIAANVASFTLMPIVAIHLVDDSAAGVPATLSMIGRSVGGYPIGWIMDRFGRRFGLSLGYLVATLGGLLSMYAIGWESFFGFCLGMGFIGAGRGASEQARFVAAEVSEMSMRAKVIGFIVAAGIVGGIAGPFAVAPSQDLMPALGFAPLTGPYFISALLALLALLLVLFLLFPEPKKLSQLIEMQERSPLGRQRGDARIVQRRSWGTILRVPAVQLAMAALVIGQFVMVWLMVIMAVHMSHNNHTTEAIAWVIALHNAGMYAFSWSVGWVIARIGLVSTIVAGAFILALSTIMAPLSVGFPVLAASMFLVGLGWAFTFVAGSALLSNALSVDERTQVQGASESLVAAAGGVGSLATGVIYARFGGMPTVGVLGLVISIALVLAVSRYALTSSKPAAA